MEDQRKMVEQALAWQEEGRRVALATVMDTWGSSPRPVGSQLVVGDDGRFEGSVSGGCIEGAVVSECLDVIEEGTPLVLEYGVSDAAAMQVGLACGGRITVLYRRAEPPELLRAALAARPSAVVTRIADGAAAVLGMSGPPQGPLPLGDEIVSEARAAMGAGRSRHDVERGLFIHVLVPPPRMIVIGAAHIAQSLVPMALGVGFEVMVVDPRRAFVTPDRLPDAGKGRVELSHEWPDKAIERLGLDAWTAVVALSHDYKIDAPALKLAVRSDAFYIGALGSTRTHAQRVKRLLEEGFAQAEIDRIRAPIGLDLGGRSPGEIAVSILAEVIAARHGKRLGSL